MAVEADTGSGDQRVTNATILLEVKSLRKELDKVADCFAEFDKRQRADHDQIIKLDTKINGVGIFNLVGSFVAGIVGVNK